MRTATKFFSTALFSFAAFSCSKSAKDPVPVARTGDAIATINGVSFTPAQMQTDCGLRQIHIASQSANGDVLGITMDTIAVGTFNITGGQVPAIDYYVGGNLFSSNAYDKTETVGTINITSVDLKAMTFSGKFNSTVRLPNPYVAVDTITKGSFTRIGFISAIPGGGSSLFARLNGTVIKKMTTVFGVNANGSITLQSGSEAGEKIVLVFPPYVPVGDHAIGLQGTSINATFTDASSNLYYSTAGTLTITKIDLSARRVEGSFSFTAQDGYYAKIVSITGGKFALTLAE